MKLWLLAIGKSMPAWVTAGYQEYAKRLASDCPLSLIEIPAEKRSQGMDLARIQRIEGERMLAKIPVGSLVIALEINGKTWSTEQLATQMQHWRESGQDIAFLIGGPEGLAPSCQAAAQLKWSLSPLTLPHPLVRIVIAEQLYRAWTILQNHPYHR